MTEAYCAKGIGRNHHEKIRRSWKTLHGKWENLKFIKRHWKTHFKKGSAMIRFMFLKKNISTLDQEYKIHWTEARLEIRIVRRLFQWSMKEIIMAWTKRVAEEMEREEPSWEIFGTQKWQDLKTECCQWRTERIQVWLLGLRLRPLVDIKIETERKILELMDLYMPAVIPSDELLAFLKDSKGKLKSLL